MRQIETPIAKIGDAMAYIRGRRISKQSGRVAVRGAIRACSLRILHARTNEVCFVGGNLRGSIGRGGGWRVMYTRARGVEVGKWPARRARRPTDLERYRSAAGPTPAAARRHGQHSRGGSAAATRRRPPGTRPRQKHSFVCPRPSAQAWETSPC